MKYVCLLRGINVGGKNAISMATLRSALEQAEFTNVTTYINSGNIILESTLSSKQVEQTIEKLIPTTFKLDSELIKVRALSHQELKAIVAKAPEAFGQAPSAYHSDVLFPMNVSTSEIMASVELHPDVDAVWENNGVVYFRRLSAMRTKSRLGKIISKPIYKSITIRSWNTTVKLLSLLGG